MKRIYCFIIAVVLTTQNFDAQYVGQDPDFTSLSNVGQVVFSNTGNIYRGYLGIYSPNSSMNYNITRYLPNGTVDPNFGNNGTISPSQNITFRAEVENNLYLSSGNKVLKFNFNGTPNSAFGNNGECILNIPDNGSIVNLVVSSDQSIYVKTSSTSGYNLFKVLPTGAVDAAFGVKNFGALNFNLSKINNNSLVISHTGSNTNEYKLIKYTPQGDLDTTFGNMGNLILPYVPNEVLVDKQNKIITRQGGTLRKYNTDGILDTGFGNNGEFNLSSLTTELVVISNMDIDKNNKIMLFGNISSSKRFFIGRINTNGTPDTTFSGNATSAFYMSAPDMTLSWSTLTYCKSTDDDKYNCYTNQRMGLASYQQNVIKFTSNFPASLSTSEAEIKNVEIYSNPVSDVLNIRLGINEKLQKINIYSMDGRLVFTGTDEKTDIKFLSAGNYLLEVKTNKNTYNKKIIKN